MQGRSSGEEFMRRLRAWMRGGCNYLGVTRDHGEGKVVGQGEYEGAVAGGHAEGAVL